MSLYQRFLWSWPFSDISSQNGKGGKPGLLTWQDDAKRAFFACDRWGNERQRLDTKVGLLQQATLDIKMSENEVETYFISIVI